MALHARSAGGGDASRPSRSTGRERIASTGSGPAGADEGLGRESGSEHGAAGERSIGQQPVSAGALPGLSGHHPPGGTAWRGAHGSGGPRRALHYDTVSYASIKAILASGADREPLPDGADQHGPPVEHGNVRGGDYYGSNEEEGC